VRRSAIAPAVPLVARAQETQGGHYVQVSASRVSGGGYSGPRLGGHRDLGANSHTPAQTKAKLERLTIAVAPIGYDTNLTWLQARSGNLDKRPALEFLVGIDRYTGAYIPELAETWEMAPDGKTWTVWLRQGSRFTSTGGSLPPQTCATLSS